MTILAYESVGSVFPKPLPTWKRVMDISGALLGILLSLPLCALVALFIVCTSPGPIFYRSKRVGYNGELFTMWKFRTMEPGEPVAHQAQMKELIRGSAMEAPMTKRDNDPRLIALAGVIRKTCIDEIPQLINVLRGEMSLVGPRPALPYEAAEYSTWHCARQNSVPGMTGLWQVSGKNRLSFREMVALDIRYSREMSFWLDLRIVLATSPAILRQVIDHVNTRRFRQPAGVQILER